MEIVKNALSSFKSKSFDIGNLLILWVFLLLPTIIYVGLWFLLGPVGFWQTLAMLVLGWPFLVVQIVLLSIIFK